jgi:hypothetical protein
MGNAMMRLPSALIFSSIYDILLIICIEICVSSPKYKDMSSEGTCLALSVMSYNRINSG